MKDKKKGTYSKPGVKKVQAKDRDRPRSSAGDQKTIKQLLGELYGDKEYLEKLMKDPSKHLFQCVVFLMCIWSAKTLKICGIKIIAFYLEINDHVISLVSWQSNVAIDLENKCV